MSKVLKNGHDKPAEVHTSTARTRRYRERRRKGFVVLQAEIQPDMISALVSLGWLHASEKANRQAVTAAIGALVLRSLSAAVTPSDKPLLAVDVEAVREPWHGFRLGLHSLLNPQRKRFKPFRDVRRP
jgi:hypothetical protein